METITCTVLPQEADERTVYALEPLLFDPAYYAERTNRNIGWITAEEQQMLLNSTVGIVGCGGMGGLVACILLRLGIGTIKIGDTERFDVSNLNRQAAATQGTIGVSKAFATARMMRDISSDTSVIVYPQGLTEETADDFVSGCDIILDEIEFFAVASRILLHRTIREKKVVSLTCPTVGHRVYVTKFTHTSMHMEEVLKMSYEEAQFLQENIVSRTATRGEVNRVVEAMLRLAAPELPEYMAETEEYSTAEAVRERLNKEITASIITTNPPMASGFLANQVLFHLLEGNSSLKRVFVLPPPMPGYVMLDAAMLIAKRVTNKWW